MRLRNWRVPQRLIVLIVIPTALAVVLGGLRIVTAAGDAGTYGRVERLAELGRDITTLAHEFGYERDLTVGFIAAGRDENELGRLKDQQAKVDALARQVRVGAAGIDSSYGQSTADDALAVTNRLDEVKALRTFATSSLVPVPTVIDKYSESISELIAFLDGMARGTAEEDLARDAQALAALSRAKDQLSRQRAILFAGLTAGRLDSDEVSTLIDARSREESETVLFRTAATLEFRRIFDDTVSGPKVDQAREFRQRALVIAGRGDRRVQLDAEAWRDAMTDVVDRVRLVEKRLADEIIGHSNDRKQSAQQAALRDSAIVALVLLLVLLLTFVMARSLVRPLRRLRDGALEVAGTRLPGLVERLRDPQAAASGIEVDPIDIDSTDEIGQVARAFDEVHREAVRLAADEAVLRGNINAMFVNLSRRSQSLIERQLRLIDDLEQGERDEERLASLFRLDHLATRMRRNCENLLVLGGQEQVRRWNQPVPLIDIVRASLSEVEQYERIGLRIQGEVAVVGPVVNDLVHLVAELVENATAFSPEHTKVTVSGHLLSGGGAMLQITDNGVGISPEDLEAANWRLANPPVIDFSAARRMGLFVVGRLAVRHGIRVELRPALSGGITAFVLLPGALIARGNETSTGAAPRRFDMSADTAVGAAWSPAPVAAGVAPAPALGAGAPAGPSGAGSGGRPATPINRRDGFGAPPQPAVRESGAMPIVGDSGQPPGPPGHSGPQQMMGQTGPQPAVQNTGPQPSFRPGVPQPRPGQSGPQQMPGQSGPQPVIGQSGPQPIVTNAGDPSVSLTGSLPGFPSPGDTAGSPASALGPEHGQGVSWNAGGENSRDTPAGTPERSPIFDAMESEWFQRRASGSGGRPPQPWQSRGDAGWQAAEAVREPAASGVTSSGLPKRVPGRNRVPGAVAQPTPPPSPAQAQPADVVRNRFASLQRGVNRGRTEAHTDTGPPGPPRPAGRPSNTDDIAPPGNGTTPGDRERGGSL